MGFFDAQFCAEGKEMSYAAKDAAVVMYGEHTVEMQGRKVFAGE